LQIIADFEKLVSGIYPSPQKSFEQRTRMTWEKQTTDQENSTA